MANWWNSDGSVGFFDASDREDGCLFVHRAGRRRGHTLLGRNVGGNSPTPPSIVGYAIIRNGRVVDIGHNSGNNPPSIVGGEEVIAGAVKVTSGSFSAPSGYTQRVAANTASGAGTTLMIASANSPSDPEDPGGFGGGNPGDPRAAAVISLSTALESLPEDPVAELLDTNPSRFWLFDRTEYDSTQIMWTDTAGTTPLTAPGTLGSVTCLVSGTPLIGQFTLDVGTFTSDAYSQIGSAVPAVGGVDTPVMVALHANCVSPPSPNNDYRLLSRGGALSLMHVSGRSGGSAGTYAKQWLLGFGILAGSGYHDGSASDQMTQCWERWIYGQDSVNDEAILFVDGHRFREESASAFPAATDFYLGRGSQWVALLTWDEIPDVDPAYIDLCLALLNG